MQVDNALVNEDVDEGVLGTGLRATRVDEARLLGYAARCLWMEYVAQGSGIVRKEQSEFVREIAEMQNTRIYG